MCIQGDQHSEEDVRDAAVHRAGSATSLVNLLAEPRQRAYQAADVGVAEIVRRLVSEVVPVGQSRL